MRVSLQRGQLIELTLGDITQETTDAIVSAANSTLLGGGGIDGAIHRAGGPAILDQCKAIRATRGTLPPGHAVATGAGVLAARYVIHTVGPIWRGGNEGEPGVLASCYRQALRVADQLRLRSMAFPSIATGAYGYPVHDAARVAVPVVQQGLQASPNLVLVRFVVFDEATLAAYAEELAALVSPGSASRATRSR